MSELNSTLDGEIPYLPPDQDRRAAVRHPARRGALCHPVAAEAAPAWQARVRDVSSLGVGLVLERWVEPCTLLEIDLPRADGGVLRTVLGRVVYVEAETAGAWVVGCAFISELDDAELRLFRAARVKPDGADGRRWVRFPCNVETVCFGGGTAPGERVNARVVNISAGGIGLLLPCQFEEGTLLHFELPGAEARKVLVRVVRALDHANGDWFLGCEFAERLGDDEVRALLQ